MRTYAIIDAAKSPNGLTAQLEDAGLTFQSLFEGKAAEELSECSPYLVELTIENDLTRQLMTGADGIGGLWDLEMGIYVRSRANFTDMRKHLRKFTRLRDQSGTWFLWRFWEGRFWRACRALNQSHWLDAWPLSICDGLHGMIFIADGKTYALHPHRTHAHPRHSGLSLIPLASIKAVSGSIARPDLSDMIAGLPKDHWIVPGLLRLLANGHVASDTIRKICALHVGSALQIICQNVISSKSLPSAATGRALNYILNTGGCRGV